MEVDEVIQELQNQIVMQNLNAVVRSMTPKCFNLCVAKPGLKLSSSEEDCVERCVKTYNMAMAVTSDRFLKRMQLGQNAA